MWLIRYEELRSSFIKFPFKLCNTPDGPLASFGGNAHHRKDYSDDEGSGYGDDDDDEDYYNYGEEDITEMPPSVKMDEGVEVRDEVEQPRKVGGVLYSLGSQVALIFP